MLSHTAKFFCSDIRTLTLAGDLASVTSLKYLDAVDDVDDSTLVVIFRELRSPALATTIYNQLIQLSALLIISETLIS
jgi:hypothetical protein